MSAETNISSIIIGAAIALAITVAFFIQRKQTYWKRKGVTQIPPEFFFGNIRSVITRQLSMGENMQKIYEQLKREGVKHGGIYTFLTPMFIPIDMELIKTMLIKDFSHFVNHGLHHNVEKEPLSGHLFNLEDDKWRNLRVKLTPTFTSGKMKMMFQTFIDCTVGLKELLDDFTEKKEAIDIKDLLGRFTTDIIGSCAFGIECNSLKDPDAEFRKFGKKVFKSGDFIRQVKIAMIQTIPTKLLNFFNFKVGEQDIEDFFMNMVKDTVAYREKNNVFRKDFLHLLIQIKNMGEVSEGTELQSKDSQSQNQPGLTIKELAAQVFVFFIAGFETSSTTMTFALLELAQNPDVQEKVREEIEEVLKRHDGKVTYDAIMEMEYLDRVINEAIRKYPPIPLLPRICTKDYKVPGTDVTIEKGTRVSIPIAGIHNDPDYYPDPEKFDPDRFLEVNKNKRPQMSFIPFGEGPRMCIGLRFGLLQSKVGLVTTIRNFRISLNEKTKYPVEIDKDFITSVKGGVWLDTTKI